DQDAVGLIQRQRRGLWQFPVVLGLFHQCLGLAQGAAFDGDEARAEAGQTGKVLVAGRLVDFALAPEFGFHRNHGHAVGFAATVAAAFTDGLVDHHPARWVREFAALATSPFLSSAGLIVDDRRYAVEFTQLVLHVVHAVPAIHRNARSEIRYVLVFVRVVADHHDIGHAFCGQLTGYLRHAERTVDRLASGHGYGVVVEDLVGDRNLGGHSRTDRQQAGVEIGTVAEV